MRDIRNRRDIPKTAGEKLKRVFGKLTLRYTRAKVYLELKGHKSVESYEVLGKDHCSAAIKIGTDPLETGLIHHIHFEGGYYWICLGSFREYFKKIE